MADDDDIEYTSSGKGSEGDSPRQIRDIKTRFSKIKDKYDVVPPSEQDRRSFDVENIDRIINFSDERKIGYSIMQNKVQEVLTALEENDQLVRLTGQYESLEEYLENPHNNPHGEIVYSTDESEHPLGPRIVFKSQYSDYLLREYDKLLDGAIIFRSEESAARSWNELEPKPDFLEYDPDDPDDAIGVSIYASNYSPELVSELDEVFDSLISMSS